MNHRILAAVYILLAAIAWGSDSLLRLGSFPEVHPVTLIFWGHIIGLLILLPAVARPSRRELRLILPSHFPALLALGIGGEVVAGLLFTESFSQVGLPSATFLLMLRPFCVLALAFFFLRERRGLSFVQWAFWVFLGAIAIYIFDPAFDGEILGTSAWGLGMAQGGLAILLWALTTISGKWLLRSFSASTVLFLRWSISLVGFSAVMLIRGIPFAPANLLDAKLLLTLFGTAVLFALLPLWFYYKGLKKLPASLASFIELACPLTVVFLPVLLQAKKLHELQWLGGFSIVAGVILLLRMELEFESKPGRQGPDGGDSGERRKGRA